MPILPYDCGHGQPQGLEVSLSSFIFYGNPLPPNAILTLRSEDKFSQISSHMPVHLKVVLLVFTLREKNGSIMRWNSIEGNGTAANAAINLSLQDRKCLTILPRFTRIYLPSDSLSYLTQVRDQSTTLIPLLVLFAILGLQQF